MLWKKAFDNCSKHCLPYCDGSYYLLFRFFTITFDLNDQIEEFFAGSEVMTYSHDKRIVCEIPSDIAYNIVKKYFENVKFRNNTKSYVCNGISFYFEYSKNKYMALSCDYFMLNGRRYNFANLKLNPTVDPFEKMYEELDKYAVVIRDLRDE